MEPLDTLRIGKYTFAVSFLLGNVFLFGFLLLHCFGIDDAIYFAVGGYCYLYVAAIVNILILIALAIYGTCVEEKRKDSFIGIGIMLINIPLAILYAWIGMYICCILHY